MSKDCPSALDLKIAKGEADPISDSEKEAVMRFMQTYDELFGPDAPRNPAPANPQASSVAYR